MTSDAAVRGGRQVMSIALMGSVVWLSACSEGARAFVAAHPTVGVEPRRPSGAAANLEIGEDAPAPGSTTDLQTRGPTSGDLRTRFHVAFREDDTAWADGDLAAVRTALAMLDDRELAEIVGTTFVRTHTMSVTLGGALAEAVHVVGVRTEAGRPRLVQEIVLTDAAAALPRRELVAMVLHELGHVMEQAPRNHARFALMTAEADLERQRARAWTADRQFVKEYEAATTWVSSLSAADRDVAADFVAALERSALAYAGLRDDAADAIRRSVDPAAPAEADVAHALARRDLALTDALSTRERARTRFAAAARSRPVLTRLASTLTLEDAAIAAVRGWSQQRAQAAAAAARFTAATAAGDISTRLHAFIAVMDNRVGPVSSYTARILLTEGPLQFHLEMFAESFSLWKTDRQGLQHLAPDLAAWFDQGNHLK